MNTFVLGRRFEKFRNLCLVVVGALVFGFYFIYDYLYESFSWWNPGRMAFVFLLVGVLFVGITALLLTRFQSSHYYRLTANALEVSLWGRSVFYPYSDFRKAEHRFGGPFDTFPVVFTLRDGGRGRK